MRLSQLIPWLSEEHEDLLRKRHIETPTRLLLELSSSDQRKAYEILTGIPHSKLLQYANAADMRRIPGLGYRYIKLLEGIGCATLRDLATRNPDTLHKAMYENNLKHDWVLVLPSIHFVRRWVTRAKTLPKVITYR